MKELFEKAIELIEGSEKIVIAYHPDADGITSVVLVEKEFPNKEYEELSVNTIERDFYPNQIKEIEKIKPDLILNLDITPGNFKQLSELAKKYNILTIDHHQVLGKRANWNKDFYINSCVSGLRSEHYSCSKIVHEMLDGKENVWLVAVGLISDNLAEFWINWLSQFSKTDLKKFGEIGDMISLVSMAYHLEKTRLEKLGQRKRIIGLLKESDSPDDFKKKIIKDKELYKLYLLVEEELKRCVSDIKKLVKESKNQILTYEIIGLKGLVIVELLLARLKGLIPKSKVLIFYQRGNGWVQFRVLDESPKVNCAQLFLGFGGGHKNVAGGGVPLKDFDKTLRLIKRRAKEQLGNQG